MNKELHDELMAMQEEDQKVRQELVDSGELWEGKFGTQTAATPKISEEELKRLIGSIDSFAPVERLSKLWDLGLLDEKQREQVVTALRANE